MVCFDLLFIDKTTISWISLSLYFRDNYMVIVIIEYDRVDSDVDD
jgi:hypothetical protein